MFSINLWSKLKNSFYIVTNNAIAKHPLEDEGKNFMIIRIQTLFQRKISKNSSMIYNNYPNFPFSATTFHVAIRFTAEKWTDDLQITVNPVYEKTKQLVLTAVSITTHLPFRYIGYAGIALSCFMVELKTVSTLICSFSRPSSVCQDF